jgi:hypothetical protein
MTKIFSPIYGGKFHWIFPKYDENFILTVGDNFPEVSPYMTNTNQGKIPLDFL